MSFSSLEVQCKEATDLNYFHAAVSYTNMWISRIPESRSRLLVFLPTPKPRQNSISMHFNTSKCLPVPQVSPSNPSAQAQVKLATPSMQLPPFKQGLGEHSSFSSSQKVPLYPAKQIQV